MVLSVFELSVFFLRQLAAADMVEPPLVHELAIPAQVRRYAHHSLTVLIKAVGYTP
jgi:hypothetical protein